MKRPKKVKCTERLKKYNIIHFQWLWKMTHEIRRFGLSRGSDERGGKQA